MRKTLENISSGASGEMSQAVRNAELAEYVADLETDLMRERADRASILAAEREEMAASLRKEIEKEFENRRMEIERMSKCAEEAMRNLDAQREKMLDEIESKAAEYRIKAEAALQMKFEELEAQRKSSHQELTETLTKAVESLNGGDRDTAYRYLLEARDKTLAQDAAISEKILRQNEELKAKMQSKSQQNAKLIRNLYLKKHEGFALTDEESRIIGRRQDLLPMTDKEREEYNAGLEIVNKYRDRIRAEKESAKEEGKASHGRNPIPDSLLRLEPTVIFPEGYNEEDYEIIGHDDHEELVPIKERFMVRVTRRMIVVLKSDPDRKPLEAPLPEPVIYKSYASPELLAQLEYWKYGMHMPWYRISKMYEHDGFHLNRSSMCDWHTETCNLLDDLYQCQIDEVMKSPCLAADGCPMPMIDNEKHMTVNKYLVSIRSVVTGIPIFRAAPSELFKGNWRGKSVIQYYLKDWTGKALLCDACQSYDWLKKVPGVILCRCVAHWRREVEAALKESRELAEELMLYIQYIYVQEAFAKHDNLKGDELKEFRNTYERPIWNTIYKWCCLKLPELREGSLIQKAVRYFLRRNDELTAYLDIPEMPIDNNDCERNIREMVMGKKAYLFCENEQSCYRAAMMYTFLGACKVTGKDPCKWMTHVLRHIKTWPKDRLVELLPQNWSDLR